MQNLVKIDLMHVNANVKLRNFRGIESWIGLRIIKAPRANSRPRTRNNLILVSTTKSLGNRLNSIQKNYCDFVSLNHKHAPSRRAEGIVTKYNFCYFIEGVGSFKCCLWLDRLGHLNRKKNRPRYIQVKGTSRHNNI